MIAMTTNANAASTAAPQEQERVREEEVAKSRLDGHLAFKRPTARAVGSTPDRGGGRRRNREVVVRWVDVGIHRLTDRNVGRLGAALARLIPTYLATMERERRDSS